MWYPYGPEVVLVDGFFGFVFLLIFIWLPQWPHHDNDRDHVSTDSLRQMRLFARENILRNHMKNTGQNGGYIFKIASATKPLDMNQGEQCRASSL